MRPLVKKTLMAPAIALIFLAPVAYAQMDEGGGGEKAGHFRAHLMAMLKIAELSPNQWAQVKPLLKSTHATVRPLEVQVKTLHEQLTDKLAGTAAIQLSDLDGLRQQIRTLQQKIDDQALGLVIQIRGLLSSEQLQKIATTHSQLASLRSQIQGLTHGEDNSAN